MPFGICGGNTSVINELKALLSIDHEQFYVTWRRMLKNSANNLNYMRNMKCAIRNQSC